MRITDSALFPAPWPASMLHCPAVKRDPVSSGRPLTLQPCSRGRGNVPPSLSRGGSGLESVSTSLSAQKQRAVTEGAELSALDEESKESAHSAGERH